DGVTGLLVPPEDSAAIAGALLRLLRDPELSQKMAESGKNVAVENYGFERLIREVDALYTELLRRRGRSNSTVSTTPKWAWRVARLRSMSKDELVDRVSQHVNARLDAYRAQHGHD